MSRLGELESRREALVSRCAAQRMELTRLLAPLRPRSPTEGGAAADAPRAARHPLAGLALLGALALFGRTREVLSLLLLLRSAVSLAARAGALLRQLRRWRAARAP